MGFLTAFLPFILTHGIQFENYVTKYNNASVRFNESGEVGTRCQADEHCLPMTTCIENTCQEYMKFTKFNESEVRALNEVTSELTPQCIVDLVLDEALIHEKFVHPVHYVYNKAGVSILYYRTDNVWDDDDNAMYDVEDFVFESAVTEFTKSGIFPAGQILDLESGVITRVDSIPGTDYNVAYCSRFY